MLSVKNLPLDIFLHMIKSLDPFQDDEARALFIMGSKACTGKSVSFSGMVRSANDHIILRSGHYIPAPV